MRDDNRRRFSVPRDGPGGGTVRALALGALCLVLVSSAAAPHPVAASKHFLWSVRAGGGTVYLLGSVHLVKPDLYPLDAVIEEAFARSDTLEVEVNAADLDATRRNALIKQYGFYRGDDTLKGALSPETYAGLDARFAKLGVDMERFAKMRPWLVALALQMMELQRLGFDPQYGIDLHFINQAKGRKTIGELETFDSQMRLLSGLSDRDQELFLRYTLADLDLVAGEMDRLMTAWRRGDVATFRAVILKERSRYPEFEPIYRKLIDERNRMMFERIETLLNTPGTYFVVVGSGHLVGEGSVNDLLRRKGYEVDQL
jgi:uncharacterized protein